MLEIFVYHCNAPFKDGRDWASLRVLLQTAAPTAAQPMTSRRIHRDTPYILHPWAGRSRQEEEEV